MYFLLVLIASTRRDASVILTPGTGDSVGTRGAVAAALELITAVPMPSSTTAIGLHSRRSKYDAINVNVVVLSILCRWCVGSLSTSMM